MYEFEQTVEPSSWPKKAKNEFKENFVGGTKIIVFC